MLAVTGVDDDGRARLAHDVRRTGVLVAHDDAVDLIGVEPS